MDDMNNITSGSSELNQPDRPNQQNEFKDLNQQSRPAGFNGPVFEEKKDKRGFAITSLVLGIVSLVLFCVWYVSLPCAILGIIFGALSTKSSGRGMAIAGIVTSIVAIAVDIIVIVLSIAVFSEILSTMPY